MTDVRETLNEIAQRADAASRMLMTGSKPWLVRDSAIDVPRLVAALRAVLDQHVADGEGYGDKVVCAYCSWLDEDMLVDYPCDTVEAITEALGGDA